MRCVNCDIGFPRRRAGSAAAPHTPHRSLSARAGRPTPIHASYLMAFNAVFHTPPGRSENAGHFWSPAAAAAARCGAGCRVLVRVVTKRWPGLRADHDRDSVISELSCVLTVSGLGRSHASCCDYRGPHLLSGAGTPSAGCGRGVSARCSAAVAGASALVRRCGLRGARLHTASVWRRAVPTPGLSTPRRAVPRPACLRGSV